MKPKEDDSMEDKPKNDLERKTFEMEFLLEKDDRFKDVKLKAVVNLYGYFCYNFETANATVALQLSNYLKEKNYRLYATAVNNHDNLYELRFIKK